MSLRIETGMSLETEAFFLGKALSESMFCPIVNLKMHLSFPNLPWFFDNF